MRFKESRCLHNIKEQGEAANMDIEAAASYPDLTKVIHEGDHTKRHMFDVNDSLLYWKKMPFRTFHS